MAIIVLFLLRERTVVPYLRCILRQNGIQLSACNNFESTIDLTDNSNLEGINIRNPYHNRYSSLDSQPSGGNAYHRNIKQGHLPHNVTSDNLEIIVQGHQLHLLTVAQFVNFQLLIRTSLKVLSTEQMRSTRMTFFPLIISLENIFFHRYVKASEQIQRLTMFSNTFMLPSSENSLLIL